MEKIVAAAAVQRALLLAGVEPQESQVGALAEVLSSYPDDWVEGACVRVATECRGRIALADFLERLADGRPGPEEAWGHCPRDEVTTVVWTEETRAAFFGAAARVLVEDGEIPARMAFVEAYKPRVAEARRSARPVRWVPSLGADTAGRVAPLVEAVRLGRLRGASAWLLVHAPEVAAAVLAEVAHSTAVKPWK